jgi:ribosomal protein L11 methyltransferase
MARPLKNSSLSQVSIVTSFEAEEPVAALLERVFAAAPSIYSDLEKQQSVATLYASAAPGALRAKEAELREGLAALREMGLDAGSGEIAFKKVRREDWAESWKKHFKPIAVGSALLIKPSWSRQSPRAGQAVVVLDPGLSFGTGQHATTSFCLKQLVALRPKGNGARALLDAGCGSGILAISAAKLGFGPVEAFDFDPVAVRIAEKNCRSNRVEKKVRVGRQDLTKLPLGSRAKYDVICANLISTLLISERDRLLNRLAPDGVVILAGILGAEFETVRRAYEEAGLRLVKSAVQREWQSGSFKGLV